MKVAIRRAAVSQLQFSTVMRDVLCTTQTARFPRKELKTHV